MDIDTLKDVREKLISSATTFRRRGHVAGIKSIFATPCVRQHPCIRMDLGPNIARTPDVLLFGDSRQS